MEGDIKLNSYQN